jgi:hypothetical protein
MKYFKNLNSLRSLLLSICLVVFAMTLTGCGGTQSETKAERARRWRMVTGSGLGQINDDIDALLMMDKRSKLSENVIRDY